MMRFFICICCLFLLEGMTGQTNESHSARLSIVPQPQFVERQAESFLVPESIKLYADSDLRFESEYFIDMCESILSVKVELTSDTHQANVHLSYSSLVSHDEGYVLDIDTSKIVVKGLTAQGVFYALQSLKQLMLINISSDGTCKLPCVLVKDEPRFKYRGMHLDVGRHFFPIEFIKKYIDILALHKINTFHWHLTEDQGWRIEIKKYPRLTEIGAWRKETLIGHMNDKPLKYDGKPYGGFYTQEEIKEVIAYATERHVTIIPEIDMPAHSLAAIAAYPHLGADGKQYEVACHWGVFPQIYAPTEEVFTFLEDVLTEVISLFPGKYIHIGGDEALKDQWEKSEVVQQIIKEQGLKNEHELQTWFINRIGRFISAKGRHMIGWDEILDGGAPDDATIMYWRSWLGTKKLEAAMSEGHEVIMTPASHCYFDHYQVADSLHQYEPLANMGHTSIQKVYNMSIVPHGLEEELHPKILGAQGNVWTEYITSEKQVEYMVLPRLTALSEVLWTKKELRNWDDFYKRLQHIALVFEQKGVNYAPHFIKQ